MVTDDIVTRLRNGLFYEVWDDTGIHWKSEIRNKDIWDAINEIERLRGAVDDQSATIRHLTLKMQRMFNEMGQESS